MHMIRKAGIIVVLSLIALMPIGSLYLQISDWSWRGMLAKLLNATALAYVLSSAIRLWKPAGDDER
jgi:chromate transport protein ChrA